MRFEFYADVFTLDDFKHSEDYPKIDRYFRDFNKIDHTEHRRGKMVGDNVVKLTVEDFLSNRID